MYLVYILKSDNLSYVGMTNNFFKRFRQHNQEIKGGAKYTKKKLFWYPICIIDGFKDKISYSFYIGKNEINKEVIFFLGKTETTTIKISHEHLDFAWLDFKSALERVTYNNAKNVLTKANNLLQDRI